MLNDPKICDHSTTAKQGNRIICLLCMQFPEDLKKNDTIHVSVQEDISMKEAVG